MKSPGGEGRKRHLDSLRVFDRLEVGPVALERRRIVAPYVLFTGKGRASTELIYRYEEAVFDPSDKSSQNLGAVIAAQLAINYGLFCKSIVFRGVFDDSDRRFIRRMLEMTAREIFVKKFLQPNPFLVGDARHIRPYKAGRYCRADVAFADALPRGPLPRGAQSPRELWSTDKKKHAILSSGGKDSLLSYALLNEAGLETHPLFVNESGRHWFTALNAYNHFKARVPNTARVWTNSDRVFAWMLRHMPFVRKDFAEVRSDDYPIRLWTVAVFLFGVLPLMQKRGIARLIVGDEYDTTLRMSHKGISHYNGLYDQSTYFDNALSRYYMRKGWSISQFSILRPLSEFLVQKVLVERYPRIQELQTSCHATHKDGGRIRPCGRCEKCRRIVGMLTALDADPTRCGYAARQIEDCLKGLERGGLHQEAQGVRHMMFLLSRKGAVTVPRSRRRSWGERPEIMKLRFDPNRSPMSAVPVDLREPVIRIGLRHSTGALRREGRGWAEFDPLTDPMIDDLYPFETAGAGRASPALVSKERT